MNTERRHESRKCIEKIIHTVADEKGVEPTALPPLAHSIDCDALANIISNDSSAGFRSVAFIYAGYDVTVEVDDTTTISVDKRSQTTTNTSNRRGCGKME